MKELVNKKKDYVKFEVQYWFNKDGHFCKTNKCIEKGNLSNSFLDSLWDNEYIDKRDLKVQK